MKRNFKPWINTWNQEIHEKRRDKLLKQYINFADQTLKENYRKDYKYLRTDCQSYTSAQEKSLSELFRRK